jgi:hypothetical protein
MRTTIHLPDDLLAQAKRAALESGTTLTAVIEEALRERLARREERPSKPVRVTTFGGSGLQPGVDLDDSAALLDLMERPDADA